MIKLRYTTHDREATPILTNEQIGPKRSKTPEGFLLCSDVAISRVGEMIYSKDEVPVEANNEGFVRIRRDADELFHPTTIASFNGKPLVDDHPDVDVSPANWKQLCIGIVMNPRRGDGDDADVLLADLLVTDATAILDIDAGKREVSAGYDADYEQSLKGEGFQRNIIGNHVALVERGRCGPRCAIGDHLPPSLKGNETMPSTTSRRRATVSDDGKARVRRIFRDAEEAALEALGGAGMSGSDGMGTDADPDDQDPNGNHTHIHIHGGGEGAPPKPAAADDADPAAAGADPMNQRISAIEAAVASLTEAVNKLVAPAPAAAAPAAPTGDETQTHGDPTQTSTAKIPSAAPEELKADDAMPEELAAALKGKTNDSMALETSFRAVIADAEILVPGFRLPTFDSKTPRKATLDSMCQLRRSVIGSLALTTDGAALLASANAGAIPDDLAKSTCAAVAQLFRGAATAKRASNQRALTGDGIQRHPNGFPKAAGTAVKAPTTIAEMNALNRQFHERKTS